MLAIQVGAHEAERANIARELHDEMGQQLTALRLLLRESGDSPAGNRDERLRQAREIVDDLLRRVRRVSFDLRPPDLDRLGLLPALVSLVERFMAQTGVLVNFEHQGLDARLSPDLETGAYRIVQEALTNATRHARVTEIDVFARVHGGRLQLQVTDHGAGFDPQSAARQARSSGLTGMQQRATLLGGRVDVESSPDRGTAVIADLPLENEVKA